jgi:hypothetical protein
MDGKQKINCTVESCKYNNPGGKECTLNRIIVTPMDNCNTKNADESMCSSYKFGKNILG